VDCCGATTEVRAADGLAGGSGGDGHLRRFVSDLRAPTPSAAAEIVSQSKAELFRRVEECENRLKGAMRFRLSTLRHFLASKVGSRGFAVAEAQLKRLAQRVDDLGFRLERFGRGGFVRDRGNRIELYQHKMESAIQRRIRRSHEAFAGIAHKLDALSPLAVLERGYAVCLTPEGKVIRDAESVEVNDPVKVRLHRGILHARVSGKDI
jgi:exodeoxyribonuclease VII large subunit